MEHTYIYLTFCSYGDTCKCGYPKSQHADEAIKPDSCTDETWNRDRHIHEVPTDAFGKISFGGLGQRLGKVKASFLSLLSLSGPSGCCINLPYHYISVRTCLLRHQPGHPLPAPHRAVEALASQPPHLGDRRGQKLLPQVSPQGHVPQRSGQSGPNHR